MKCELHNFIIKQLEAVLYCERSHTQYNLVDAIRVATGQKISSKFLESFQTFNKVSGNVLEIFCPFTTLAAI